ncbi:hypothetical protein SO802_027840 [Lithocarpus litseifolius]|uniref:Aminotransferase-like plant mobile domain-containing protein n=1 Tax=Lithocarpus litseifolius TaxID=425828 RepID=A0AAW2BNI9_9ROSI
MSITLQDIAILTGLPIDGTAVCGPTNLNWERVCQELLGVTPPENALTYGGLKITWVRNTFSNLPEDANAITTQQYARAYMFQVLALLFGNKSQSRLHCCFLHLLANFGIAGEYSWGSATLALLYKELCTAAIRKSTEVVWTPYDGYLHDWCLAEKHIWMTTAPLLCFQIVEYYHPERVMQQFGLLQRCPKWPTDNFDKSVHCVKMTGKSGVNWSSKHAHYYQLWNERAQRQVGDDNFQLFQYCTNETEEDASVTDSEEDASNEDSGEDVEDAEEMEVSSDNETDEGGNYQTDFDIRTQPRRMGKSPVQARRYLERVNRHPPCCGTQQKLHVPHRGNH